MSKKAIIFENVTFFVGSLLTAFVGIFFMLFTDLYMSEGAPALIVSTLCAMGGAIFTLLSVKFKHRPKIYFLFRWIGAILTIGLVFFLLYYYTVHAGDAVKYKYVDTLELLKVGGILLGCLIASAVAACTTATNLVFNAVNGVEE